MFRLHHNYMGGTVYKPTCVKCQHIFWGLSGLYLVLPNLFAVAGNLRLDLLAWKRVEGLVQQTHLPECATGSGNQSCSLTALLHLSLVVFEIWVYPLELLKVFDELFIFVILVFFPRRALFLRNSGGAIPDTWEPLCWCCFYCSCDELHNLV